MTDAQQTNVNLEQVLGVLRRRLPWILACCALAAGAAYGLSRHQTKQYTATASLVFNDNQLNQQVAGLTAVSSSSPQAQQNTNLKLVQLGDMATITARLLGSGLTKDAVDRSLSVTAQPESNIVNVAATSTSPVLAANIANTYSNQFVTEQQNANHVYYSSALALVDKQLAGLSPGQRVGAAGLALEDRAQSLAVLAELRSGSVQIAQTATVPTVPSSPKVSRNTALGAVLGLLLGLGLAFLLDRLDRQIRDPKDLEAVYHLPLLGVVPDARVLARSARREGGPRELLPPSEAEAFHLIRAHLRYFNVDRELHTLLVTSATPGDGKTTIARYLAAAAARTGTSVLLLEADLRRPTVAQQLDIESGPGLSDVLIGSVSLEEATQSIGVDRSLGDERRALDVLVAGTAPPPNPGELIESHAMETVLEQSKSIYDLVLIDTSPLVAVSDAFPLLRKVDGVIIVGRIGHDRRDVAERLAETLDGVGSPLLGVIANRFKPHGRGSYAYGYSYNARRNQPTPPSPSAERSSAHGVFPTAKV